MISKWPHHALTCLCYWSPSAAPSHHTAVPEVDHVLDLFSSVTTNSVVERWVCCFTAMMCVVCNYSLLLHYICIIKGSTGLQCTAKYITLQGRVVLQESSQMWQWFASCLKGSIICANSNGKNQICMKQHMKPPLNSGQKHFAPLDSLCLCFKVTWKIKADTIAQDSFYLKKMLCNITLGTYCLLQLFRAPSPVSCIVWVNREDITKPPNQQKFPVQRFPLSSTLEKKYPCHTGILPTC